MTQLHDGTFLADVGITVSETLLGLVSGSLAGIAVGLVLPQMRIVSRVIEPFLMVLNGIPVIVIAPLFILWLGLGLLSKIGISIYIVFFAMFIPVYTASLRLDHDPGRRLARHGRDPLADLLEGGGAVVVPERLYRSQDRIGLALIGAVIGEFVASRSGLGHMILYASGTLDTPTLYLGIIRWPFCRSLEFRGRRDGASAGALAVLPMKNNDGRDG